MKKTLMNTAVLSGLAALGCAALFAAPASAASDPFASIPAAQRPAPGTPNLAGAWEMPKRITALKTSDGKDPPLLPAAKAEYEKRMAALKADPTTDPVAKCWMHGVPRLMYAPYPFLIAQEKDRIAFVHEVNHTFRVVTMTKTLPPLEDMDALWLGYSAGKWEGKTLVIDTAGFNDKTWLDYSGLPHGTKLRVQERYTLKDANTIEGTVTITDPDFYSAPWTTAFTLKKKANYVPEQMACVRDRKM